MDEAFPARPIAVVECPCESRIDQGEAIGFGLECGDFIVREIAGRAETRAPIVVVPRELAAEARGRNARQVTAAVERCAYAVTPHVQVVMTARVAGQVQGYFAFGAAELRIALRPEANRQIILDRAGIGEVDEAIITIH